MAEFLLLLGFTFLVPDYPCLAETTRQTFRKIQQSMKSADDKQNYGALVKYRKLAIGRQDNESNESMAAEYSGAILCQRVHTSL